MLYQGSWCRVTQSQLLRTKKLLTFNRKDAGQANTIFSVGEESVYCSGSESVVPPLAAAASLGSWGPVRDPNALSPILPTESGTLGVEPSNLSLKAPSRGF